MEGLATWLHTPQKVIETRQDHMWSALHATQASSIPSRAHLCHHWVISSGRDCQTFTNQSLTVPTIQTFDQLWWVLHCLSVLPGEKDENLQVNLPQKQYTIQQCQPALDNAPCKASVKRARITSHLL